MSQVVAQRYATALADLSLEDKIAQKVREELESFLSAFRESKELSIFLTNKVFQRQERQQMLQKIFEGKKISELTKNFLEVLAIQNRFGLFEGVVKQFGKILNEIEKVSEASVTSAVPLSKALQEKLKDKLQTAAGKKLNIHYEVDDALLGGVITRIGNQIFDGSLRTQLGGLKKQMGVSL